MSNVIKATVMINEDEVEVDVKYSISGRYYAATRDCPAEYPELEIEAVYLISHPDQPRKKFRPTQERIDLMYFLSEESLSEIKEAVEAEERL